MVEIECLLCEKPIKLPKYIDTENYDGEVVCQECQSLLYIKLVKSKVQKYSFKQRAFRRISGEQMAQILEAIHQEEEKEESERHGNQRQKECEKIQAKEGKEGKEGKEEIGTGKFYPSKKDYPSPVKD